MLTAHDRGRNNWEEQRVGGGGLQNWIVKYFFDVALELFLQKSDWQPF